MTRSVRLTWLTALLLSTPCIAEAQPRWKLIEDLRIGGGTDGPTLLSEVVDFDVDAQGRIALYDAKAGEVRLFAADGRLIRVLGRQGQGPGEYTRPNGLLFTSDGTLWVNDFRNSRFVGFTRGGEFLRQITIPRVGAGYRWDAVLDSAGRVTEMFTLRVPATGEAERRIRRFDLVRATLDTVAIPPCLPVDNSYMSMTFEWRAGSANGVVTVPFAPMMSLRLAPSGGIACATGHEYRARIVRLDGTIVADLRSAAAPVSLPRNVRDSAVEALYRATPQMPPGSVDLSRIPGSFPRVEQIDIDDAGQLWIRRQTGRGVGIDVWDGAGRHVASIEPPLPFRRGSDLIVRRDRAYAVVMDADDVPAIIRYRIVR